MKWIKAWGLLILALVATSGVIGWKEKRCQFRAYQCRANYTAQLSPRLAANEQASAQQAIAAACEPNGYFCHLFNAANLPSMLLVLIGAGGTFAALRTLRAIESQTGVLIEGQRPRIVATAYGDLLDTLADPDAPRITLRVVNKSSTPATDYRYESWIEVLTPPFEDFTVAADHFSSDVKSVLYPDTPQSINVPIRGGITPEDFREVRKLRKIVCVRLYVEYADPFIANRRCYANFGFEILPKGLGFLKKYNGVGYEDQKS
jgi:hypothetical protein